MNRAPNAILLLLVSVSLSSCKLMMKHEVKEHKMLYQEMHEGRTMRARHYDLYSREHNRRD